MSVKLELYRVFKEVAEAGNITAAAQALYISQSAVSQSIKQLEGELQTRLFARNSRGVALTPDGRMLYEYVRSAIGLLETGEEKLSQSRELQMGHLTIGASDTVTSQFLLPYLDRFHRQYPAIHIQIVSGRSHKNNLGKGRHQAPTRIRQQHRAVAFPTEFFHNRAQN